MKTLVIYDSNFGNTKTIAKAITKGLGQNTNTVSVDKYYKGLLEEVELLIIGSPINAWRPTENILKLLNSFTEEELEGLKCSTFDTRVRFFIHGDACKKIAKKLEEVGGEIISEPTYYYVNGKEGPLEDGEEDRAKEWGRELRKEFIKLGERKK
jgi:flavodoxin